MWAIVKDVLKEAAGYLAAFFSGKYVEKKEQAERNADDYKKQAQEFADQPVTDDDFERLQRERIERKGGTADQP